MKEPVLIAIETAFAAIATQYRMRVLEEAANDPEFRVLFVNGTTGLEVVVDWAELRPFVWLCRLDAAGRPWAHEPGIGGPLRRVDVDDILLHRDVPYHPVGKLLARADVESLASLLDEYARALELGCGDVLDGDFSVFDALRPAVEARVRDFRKLMGEDGER